MQLLTLDYYLKIYNRKKGILRWLFGDQKDIAKLKQFYQTSLAQHHNNSNELFTATEIINLFSLIFASDASNLRLSGAILRAVKQELYHSPLFQTLEALSQYGLNDASNRAKLEAISDLSGYDLIFKHINEISNSGITQAIFLKVMEHPNKKQLVRLTTGLANKPCCKLFTENHILDFIDNSYIFSDEAILELTKITPTEFYTTETTSALLSLCNTDESNQMKVFKVINFLNQLIHFDDRHLLAKSDHSRKAPAVFVTQKQKNTREDFDHLPSRFSEWFFAFFSSRTQKAKIIPASKETAIKETQQFVNRI